MGEDDVPHVHPAEAQLLHLPDGGVLFVEEAPGHVDEQLPDPFERLLFVQQADAGVHQGEPGLISEHQAVADHLRVRRRLHRATVDVVDGRRHRILSPSGFVMCGLTSDSVFFGYHARPGVIRTFMGREGLLAFIRNTICSEANSNVKCEMTIFRGRGDPALKANCHSRRVPLLLFEPP